MIIFDFLAWHYGKKAKGILKAWLNFVELGLHLFSVRLLLRTLFAPWRRIVAEGTIGFSFKTFFDRLIFNLISRTIGFLVRSILIFWGLLVALFFLILGLPLFLLWFLIPFLTWPIFLVSRPKKKTNEELLRGEAKAFVWQRLGVKSEEELAKISPTEVGAVLAWYLRKKAAESFKHKFWLKENLFKLSALGTDLAFGYTLGLDQYTEDLAFPPPFSHQMVGRKKEIAEIESVLLRSAQANVLLIGEPGVGKRAVLLGLAKAIREKQVQPALFYKRVLLLDMNLLLGKGSLAEAKAKFDLLLKEADQAGNIILVIDQIEKYMSFETGADLTASLSQVARSRLIQLIGVTTPDNFAKYLFPNEEFVKYFEKVEVLPPSKEQALEILENIAGEFEKGKKIVVLFPALKEIVDQSDRLITNIPFPEKAIDLLDQLINQAQSSGRKLIGVDDVLQLLSQKTKVPLGSLNQTEREKLLQLEEILSLRIINQKQALAALVAAMQRARAGVAEREKPIGSFLFLGPTGVGKTETAKALAQSYFGDEKRIIRFDMAEPFSLEAFIKEARENPFSVLLLDEFEKASREVINLFLTVFDEGYFTDDQGKEVSFKNMIIICTSNAGAEFIRETLKREPEIEAERFNQEITEYVLQKNIFSPEMINRFDGVVVYKPLTTENVKAISILMMAKLKARLKVKEINLLCLPEVYDLLAQLGHSFEYGARPLRRLIVDKIESPIAKLILENKLSQGETVKVLLDEAGKEFRIKKLDV